MAATIKELLTILGLTYCIGVTLLGILIYVMLIVRLADYYLHPEAYKDEEDYEL